MVIDLSLAIAVVGCVLAILAWADSRRKAAVKEGEQKQTIQQVKDELATALNRVLVLEERLRDADGDVREIKADIKHLLTAVDRMAEKLDRHLEEGK